MNIDNIDNIDNITFPTALLPEGAEATSVVSSSSAEIIAEAIVPIGYDIIRLVAGPDLEADVSPIYYHAEVYDDCGRYIGGVYRRDTDYEVFLENLRAAIPTIIARMAAT